MPSAIRACVFDAYGTLFDVHSAVRRFAAQIGPDAADFSQLWRTKQLEYSWVRSLARRHVDFRQVTIEALEFSMRYFSINNKKLGGDLIAVYRELEVYPEVIPGLQQLRTSGVRLAILSNGTPDWLESAVRSAGIAELFDFVWSVEDVGIFKPDPQVYRIATRGFGLAAADMAFVSSNPWDAAAAATNGFRSVRVNRSKAPEEYVSLATVGQIPGIDALAGYLEV